MGSPRTCGCRGGVIVPLRPDVNELKRTNVGWLLRDSAAEATQEPQRCARAAQLCSTSLPIDEATAADPFRWSVHGAPLGTDVRGRRGIGRPSRGPGGLLGLRRTSARLRRSGRRNGHLRTSSCIIWPTPRWRGVRLDRASLPGPVAMWASLLVTQLVLVGLVIVTVRLVRHFRGASGSQHGGPARASRAHVERRMGRRAVERHTAALYGKDAVSQAGTTGTRGRRRHRRPAVRQVRGLHPGGRRAPGRQGRGVRDPRACSDTRVRRW